jgi:hypothetical protein
MTTLTLKQNTFNPQAALAPLKQYNKYSLMSIVLAALFILYFFLPHGGALQPVFGMSVLYVLFVPIAALVTSIIAVRQISHSHDKGLIMSYITLSITTLYFMVALAIPVVLIGLYLLYSYVL